MSTARVLASAKTAYRLVDSAELPGIVQQFIDDNLPIGFDMETTSLDNWSNKLITLQLGDERLCSIADLRRWEEAAESRAALRQVAELLFSGQVEVTGHNVKFDCLALAAHLDMTPDDLRSLCVADPMLVEQIIVGGIDDDSGVRLRASLEAIAKRHLGIQLRKELRSWFEDLDKRPEWNLPLPPEQLDYAAQDVTILGRIVQAQSEHIDASGLGDTLALETAALPAVIGMELAGVGIDAPGWRHLIEGVQAQADGLEGRIQAILNPGYLQVKRREQYEQTTALENWKAGQRSFLEEEKRKFQESTRTCGWGDCRKHALASYKARHPRPKTPVALPSTLNIGSTQQLQEALSLLGIDVCSTAAEVLEEESRHYPNMPVLSLISQWKKLDKLVVAFGEKVLCRVTPNGRLHPSWRQIGSEGRSIATGRMSCSEPNLQQLPRAASDEEDSIRKHVVAGQDRLLICCDFNQAEMRVLAERAQDRALLDVFERGADIYTDMAIRVGFAPAGTSKEECKKLRLGDNNLRDAMKVLTLAISYSMGPQHLGQALGVSQEEAAGYLDSFWAAYPAVARYKEVTAQYALATGYSSTIGGRRRNFRITPEPKRYQFVTTAGYKAAFQEWRIHQNEIRRQAVNATIQGTSADILKLAMVLLHRRLPRGAWLVAAIHDELIVEAPTEIAEDVARIVEQAMEQAARAYLPTVALGKMEATIAPYWKKS